MTAWNESPALSEHREPNGPVRAVPLTRRRSRVPWIYSVYHARGGRGRGRRRAARELPAPNAQLPTPNSQIEQESWELGVEELGVDETHPSL